MNVVCFFLFACFVQCNGFLLDSSTQSSSGGTIDDNRFNMLMDLLTEERRSRLRLETAVSQELLALKQEIAKCTCSNGNSQTIQSNNDAFLSNEMNALKNEFIKLSSDQQSLKRESIQNNTLINNKFQQLQHDMSTMKLSVNNMDFINATEHLEKVLQATQNEINSIKNDEDARKQDFMALYQRLQETEQNFENRSRSHAISQNISFLNLQQEIVAVAKATEENCTRKFNLLEGSQNVISSKLDQQSVKLEQELNKMANRAAMTSCYVDTVNEINRFNDIRTVIGITDLYSIRNTGTFRCEKTGFYLISVFIQTDTYHGAYFVRKNNVVITNGYSSITDYYQTTSVILLQQLVIGDVISVTGSLHVYPSYESCFSIIQIQ